MDEIKPQLWHAFTGEIRALTEYKVENGRVTIPLKMEADRSWFVIFTKAIKITCENAEIR